MLTPDSEEISKVIENFDDDDRAVLLFLVIMYSLSDPEIKTKLNKQLEPHGLKAPGIEEINWGSFVDTLGKKED
jgi:hypothetical protein